jgi:hypothetical protein
MASLTEKVSRSLPLERGERVLCASIPTPNFQALRQHGKAARRERRGLQWPVIVLATLGVGVAAAIRPGDIVTSMTLGGIGGLVGGAIDPLLRRRAGDPEADPSGWMPIFAVTDRRFVTATRSALRSGAPVAWRSVPLDAATTVETGDRGKFGVVTAFTFSVRRAGEEPIVFELQRGKEAEAFRAALAPRQVPMRPDAA